MNDELVRSLIAKALATLREVNEELSEGVNRIQFETAYAGQYVAPGMSAIRYVQQMRNCGGLEGDGEMLRFRRCGPSR